MKKSLQEKDSFIQRLIENPFEILPKAKALFRYYKAKRSNGKLLKSLVKFTYHYGVWGIGNAGDTVLFKEVEYAIQKKTFYQRDLNWGEINEVELNRLNKKGNCLVLGGGGLFLKDTNSNSNSGWQFNIAENLLDQLQIPLIIFAVGYNRFRGQEEFDKVFESHLLKTITKASFVGLRNQGSIQAIKSYLPDGLKHKVKFQPCPTTIIKNLHPGIERSFDFSIKQDRKIVINIAFDREEKRFKGKFQEIIDSIFKVCEKWQTKGWKIEFSGHCKADKKIRSFIKGKFQFVDLTYDSYSEILAYYRNVPLTVGMRGHAQMIPFGIGNAILSLISHDKMKWFLDDIEHEEWGVELLSDQFESQLNAGVSHLIDNFKSIQEEISTAQEKLYVITQENVAIIRNLRNS